MTIAQLFLSSWKIVETYTRALAESEARFTLMSSLEWGIAKVSSIVNFVSAIDDCAVVYRMENR